MECRQIVLRKCSFFIRDPAEDFVLSVSYFNILGIFNHALFTSQDLFQIYFLFIITNKNYHAS